MTDKWNAFINEHLNVKMKETGPLHKLTFAVKDVFNIEGYKSSAGNPDWLHSHPQADRNAPIVDKLLTLGACLKGTTQTDELMYSLNGENFHYGTPVNPKSNDRIPGGSSSGSAVAVSAGLVDFAIGTDTGGSIRVPSSYCGIYGFRPTHGLLSNKGVIPLARSFDTVGWMTRDADLLLTLGEEITNLDNKEGEGFSTLYFVEETWSYVDEVTKEAYRHVIGKLKGMVQSYNIIVSDKGLAKWADLFRYKQGVEIWKEHGEWIQKVKPNFGPGIAERFHWTSTLNHEKLSDILIEQDKIRNQLSSLLKKNGLLVIPTTPGEAPLKNTPLDEMEKYRSETMKLTCIAGLSGFPQVTMPLVKENGMPIGLSFIASQYEDLKLLQWVKTFSDVINQ